MLTTDAEGVITKANSAARRILAIDALDGLTASVVFEQNPWVLASIAKVGATGVADIIVDAEVKLPDSVVSVNLSTVPLRDIHDEVVGDGTATGPGRAARSASRPPSRRTTP